MELKSDSIEANASTPGLSPHAGIPSTIVTAALSLSHCSRESQEWKRRRYAARGPVFLPLSHLP